MTSAVPRWIAATWRTAALCAALLAALSLPAGCAVPVAERPTVVSDEALRQELTKPVADLYPASFHAVHRVTLTVRGQDSPLTGYVVAQQPGKLRLVATSEMGGTLFDVALDPGKPGRVLRNPSGLRPSWLLNGALRDAAAIYLARPGPCARLAQNAEGDLCLLDDLPGGVEREFRFTGPSHRLAEYSLWRGSKQLYRIRFSEERTLPGWRNAIPTVMEIEDHELGYQASVQVLVLRAIELH